MKKIRSKFDNKDRIICKTTSDTHNFYYQPYKTNEQYWLFYSKNFSGSIFKFFRDYGRKTNDTSYSLTLKEIYEFKHYNNPKLSKMIEKIPSQVEYILRENINYSKDEYSSHDEFEYVA